MSKDKKEEKKSTELVEAEKKVELEKKMSAELGELLKEHNCTLDGQVECFDGKMVYSVLYVPHMQAGEEEEAKKKRSEAAKDAMEEALKKHGHKLESFCILTSAGNKFGFRFVKLEEEKKD